MQMMSNSGSLYLLEKI